MATGGAGGEIFAGSLTALLLKWVASNKHSPAKRRRWWAFQWEPPSRFSSSTCRFRQTPRKVPERAIRSVKPPTIQGPKTQNGGIDMEHPAIRDHEISPWTLMLPPIKEEIYLRMKQETITHGQAKPIYRHGGLILSGVTDLKISIDLEREPWIIDLEDDVDPVRFLISEHFNQIDNRRNSRVVFAFRLSQGAGPGRPSSGRKEHRFTIDEAVKAVGASRKGVEQIRRISREGCAELFDAVVNYRVAITDAEGILDSDPDVQRQAVDLHRHGRARTVTRAVRKLEKEMREKGGAAAAEVHLASPLMETVTLLNSTVSDLRQSGRCGVRGPHRRLPACGKATS